MDGRLLKLLLSIHDHNSVSQAADEFDLNQSTVSHHLDRLRRDLDDPLFIKSGRGIIPTNFTIELIPRVREIVALLEGLPDHRAFDPTTEHRHITIASNASELMPELVKIRSSIADVAPHLVVRFLELGSRENVEPLLDSGEADLAITVRMAAYPSSLISTNYLCDPQVCYFDPEVRDAPLTIEDYSHARHAALDFGGKRTSTVAAALDKQSIARSIEMYAPNVYVLGELVKGTDFVVTMQSRISTSAFKGLSYCTPPMEIPDVHFDLVWHKRNESSPRSVWLRDIIFNAAK
ncbi:MAG: LysR family transcriptional regulator [Pseudomonadota bacterium]